MPSTHTSLHFHLVFSTKNRQPLIEKEWQEDLYGYLGGIVKNQGGKCLAIGGISDHVHLLVGLKPAHRLDYFMRELKASSSGWVRKNKSSGFRWQNGYGAFVVSATNLGKVELYIRNQETHHREKNFKDEYIWLLETGNIEYDEKYLW
ncbi:MAG: IS200/IS605 family transposase [Acidobacteria bacterium]|nr:IS200/IS605 family transposase [Acidobacteriota bacterium]